MKKIVLTIVTCSVFLFSCQKEEGSSITTKKIETLNQDSNFKKLVEFNLKLNQRAIDFGSKNLVSNLNASRFDLVSSDLNYKNVGAFEKDLNEEYALVNYIIDNYNTTNYTQEELEQILQIEIDQIELNDEILLPPSSESCKRKYRNDLIIITAAAVAGHIACGTVDLTVVLGAVCHSAVMVTQIAASDNAAMEYQSCMNN